MSSPLWEPIQNYIDELNGAGNPPGVHHYTNVKGALGILETGRMWFTERTHLNDPSEISHGIEFAKTILRNQNRNHAAARLDDCAKIVFRDFWFFSASFSFEPDDLWQWKNYADDGTGVALSFKASAFKGPKAYIENFIPGSTALVCPMSYDPARLEAVIGCIIEKWSGADIGELCDHLFMISGMFKNECWKPEKERRFFVHHKRDDILKSAHYKVRERNGKSVGYLDLPIPNWHVGSDFPIYRICLGPAAPDGLDAQLSEFILSNGIPIRRENISKSNLPFR